jgi:hypothetical protein
MRNAMNGLGIAAVLVVLTAVACAVVWLSKHRLVSVRHAKRDLPAIGKLLAAARIEPDAIPGSQRSQNAPTADAPERDSTALLHSATVRRVREGTD